MSPGMSRRASAITVPGMFLSQPAMATSPSKRLPRATSFAHAFLDGFGNLTQVEIAGANLGPGIRDADDRLVQVFLGEADAAQIGARRGAARSFGKRNAVLLGIMFA